MSRTIMRGLAAAAMSATMAMAQSSSSSTGSPGSSSTGGSSGPAGPSATIGHLDGNVSMVIVIPAIFGLVFSLYMYLQVARVKLDGSNSDQNSLLTNRDQEDHLVKVNEIYNAIREGADAFLRAEYKICALFIVLFGTLVFVLTSRTKEGWTHEGLTVGALTTISFVCGAVTSMISGWIGMKIAVFSNARTTMSAMNPANPWTAAFNTAFRAGGSMGYCLCSLGLLALYVLCAVFNTVYAFDDLEVTSGRTNAQRLFECVAGFGLGGSSIAMFGRVGGGIYTKAADVGADLAGKVVAGIPEDDPRNPATIADNVGDNVGDVAGMGSDLFGSFAEASCAALVIITGLRFPGATGDSYESATWAGLMFPLMISALGIVVCALCSFLATHISPVKKESDVEKVLKVQLLSTTVVITACLYPLANWAFGSKFIVTKVGLGAEAVLCTLNDTSGHCITGTPLAVCLCVWVGLWAGCAIGFITEYYTSHSYTPTREVAQSAETGAATLIIYGLALGYKSAIIPVFLLSGVVYVSFNSLDMLGVALAALGMLSNLATCLSIDVYGPVCDNAGGIAEMAELPEEVREITDALDSAGNTTAAIGKGFAIGSACLVGLALFGAFATRSQLTLTDVSLLDPVIFTFLLIGAMIPYWFSAMTMKSVGSAAMEMVKEVKRQFDEIEGLLEGTPGHAPPDHARCIKISTDASLREMVAPAVLVMTTPILTGILFGSAAVGGLLAGAISSAIQMAISASNTGGAWDNAKKYVEKGRIMVDGVVQGKGSEIHKAAVVGDTVGDPLKDTSGPALNIVMKLMAILSLVFADFFLSVNGGKGLIHWN